MDHDKAIRAAKLTLGGMLEKKRAKTAKDRAGGQIAPSKYLPNVPRQVHADGGKATMKPTMTPEQIEAQTALSDFELEEAQKQIDAVSRAGQFGSMVGKLTGIPLAGFLGRKAAEQLAMSSFADGGAVDLGNPRAVKAYGGYVPAASLPVPKLAVAKPLSYSNQPSGLQALASMAGSASQIGETASSVFGKDMPQSKPDATTALSLAASKVGMNENDQRDALKDYLSTGGANLDPATTAWCAAFVNSTLQQTGAEGTGSNMARSFLDWGHAVEQPQAGDVAVFSRGDPNGPYGHVGFFQGYDENGNILVLGGNQGDAVSVSPYPQESLLGFRRYGYADGGSVEGGYVPQKTQKAYKLFRTKGDGKLYPLFVHAEKPVEMGKWLEAEEGPQGKAQGKVKSKLGDLAYRPGWHAGDLPVATHIGGKSSPDLKKPDHRPDNHVWAEVEMAADRDWQAVADSRGKGAKAQITDQVPLGGFYRYKTNPNMTGNWLIGGHMKVNRVLSDDEVKDINDQAGVADLPRLDRTQKADGGSVAERSPMFEGMHEDLLDDEGKPMELWHGTPQTGGFEAFDDAKIGVRDPGFFGRGHYLTPIKGNAEGYADPDEMGTGTVMGPLHAALKNPYIWDVSNENASHRTLRDLQSMGIMKGYDRIEPWDNLQRFHIDPFMEEMKRRGHDGVIVKMPDYQNDRPHRVTEVVAFKPSTIKHRDAEVGDPNDPRIMRNNGGRVDLYSKAARIIRGMKDQPFDVADIVKYALGKGVKKAEIEHSDIPSGKARPSQVAEHIEFMQPQIGVHKRQTSYRYDDPERYERQINYLERQGRHEEAEELTREFEAFEGFGGKDAPLYAKYQLPGGENYREHVLTLDNHPDDQTYNARVHWGKLANPLAHIRMSDRIIGNRKILHVEELQSDWNSDARKSGFRTGREKQDYEDYVAQMRADAINGIDQNASPMIKDALRQKYSSMDPYMLALKTGRQSEHNRLASTAFTASKLPSKAPYVNPDRDDWAEMAMKHILTEAAKGGYDGIAFTPDAAQSERWKGTEFKNMYDRKFPSIAQKLAQQHDPEAGSTDDLQIIAGWGAPHVELTDKARQGILQNGFSSWRRGGYVTHVRRAR